MIDKQMHLHHYQQLKVWVKSVDLVVDVYKVTANFPKEEKYGLTNEMRKSAICIASNIAEGAGRNSDKEFCKFLANALGCSYELETQILVSERLKLLSKTSSAELCAEIHEVQKMNYSLQAKLNPDLNVSAKAAN